MKATWIEESLVVELLDLVQELIAWLTTINLAGVLPHQ